MTPAYLPMPALQSIWLSSKELESKALHRVLQLRGFRLRPSVEVCGREPVHVNLRRRRRRDSKVDQKNMPNIAELYFIDGRDGQCNRKHASYEERHMCRISEGVVLCKKIPLNATPSLRRIFFIRQSFHSLALSRLLCTS